MLNIHLNDKGITLVESLVAVVLTGIAILGLMSMQPLSWQSAAKADSMTRASGIMQRELEMIESSIMSGTIPANKTNVVETMGNASYTINTTITQPMATNSWLARVRVTWPGNTNGMKSSIIVTRQTGF
jgi:Tfp pilus assembly protein PilV